eukprot:TRINITY_DN193_c0_g2_i6.p1 TRINITY_DN193_c0_g2~~TRINITY_DN193_c0_g2_i6.p1  ORF type:complete len:371 (+),score=144.64 TRINITY_DN193_c0_g2_i6:115-1227(+)
MLRLLVSLFFIASIAALSVPSLADLQAAGLREFRNEAILKKFVSDRKCAGDDLCIIAAVGDYLKQTVNVMDCAFSEGVTSMCQDTDAVGKWKGCSLWAAFKGKKLSAEEQADPTCATCKCETKTALQGVQETTTVQSLKWSSNWSKFPSSKRLTPNTGTQEEQVAILSALGDYWNSVIEMQAGVCASLAASLAFGSRMMGVKGKITWISETYETNGRLTGSMIGHEFLVYELAGSAASPTGGYIADAWYHLLTNNRYLFPKNARGAYDFLNPVKNAHRISKLLTPLPLPEDREGYYTTANWRVKNFFGQPVELKALEAESSGCLKKRAVGDDDGDDDDVCVLTRAPKKAAPKAAPKKAAPKAAPKKANRP